jgi:hypothetical protein
MKHKPRSEPDAPLCLIYMLIITFSDKNSPDAGSSDISSDMEHRTVDV